MLVTDNTVASQLRCQQTVPRQLVHKRAIEEVLLTDHMRTGDEAFACTAQLPRMHTLYSDGLSGHYDLMALIELVRQAGILLAHAYYDVPFDYQFAFRHADFHVDNLDAVRIRPLPAEVALETNVFEQEIRKGALAGYNTHTRIMMDGIEAAKGTASVRFLTPDAYRTLRERNRAELTPSLPTDGLASVTDAELFGKRMCGNVVLAGHRRLPIDDSSFEADVRVDKGHPCFFDHDLDHIPGMLQLEAFKQLAVASVVTATDLEPRRLTPIGTDARFHRYAELDLPLSCAAVIEGRERSRIAVRMQMTQSAQAMADCTTSIAITD